MADELRLKDLIAASEGVVKDEGHPGLKPLDGACRDPYCSYRAEALRDASHRQRLTDAVRLLAGGWYLDASSRPDYADLFERGWLRRFSDEPGDYALTDAGQEFIDGVLNLTPTEGGVDA